MLTRASLNANQKSVLAKNIGWNSTITIYKVAGRGGGGGAGVGRSLLEAKTRKKINVS